MSEKQPRPTCSGTGGCKACGGLAQWEGARGQRVTCSECCGAGRCPTCQGRRTL